MSDEEFNDYPEVPEEEPALKCADDSDDGDGGWGAPDEAPALGRAESDGGWGSADIDDESNNDFGDSSDGLCAACGKSEWDCECEEEEDDELLPILGSYDAWSTDKGKLLLGGVTKILITQIRNVMEGYTGLGWGDALCLLQHTRWDADAICDLLSQSDEKRKRFLARKHMETLGPPAKYTGDGQFECGSCYVEFDGDKTFALACGHRMCISCYQDFLRDLIKRKAPVTCCECERPMPLDSLRSLLDGEVTLLRKYTDELMVQFVVNSDCDLQLCPAPTEQCDVLAVLHERYDPMYNEARCICGAHWCFNCRSRDPLKTVVHLPLSCDNLDRWNAGPETKEAKKMHKNCPGCGCPTYPDKEKGCLHMTCPRCKCHYCWECLKTPFPHGKSGDGFYSCPVVEQRKKTAKGNAKAREEETSRQQLEAYNEAYELFLDFQKGSRKFAAKCAATATALCERLDSGEEDLLVQLLQEGTNMEGGKKTGSVSELVRDAMLVLAYSAVHKYLEYELDAEERMREIQLLDMHLNRLLRETVRLVDHVTQADPDAIAESLEGDRTLASKLDAGVRRGIKLVKKALEVVITVTTKGFESLRGQRNVNFTRMMEEQYKAAQRWLKDQKLDEWGHPVGTKHPFGGAPTRKGSRMSVLVEAEDARKKGLYRPDWMTKLLYLRHKWPSQAWRIPPYMTPPKPKLDWWWIKLPDSTSALPFDKGHNDEIIKSFRSWEQHRSWEFLRAALGVPHKDHSFVNTKFPEGLLSEVLPLKVVYGNAKDLLTLPKGDFHAVHESGKTFQVLRTVEDDQWNCLCGNWMPASYRKKCVMCTSPCRMK